MTARSQVPLAASALFHCGVEAAWMENSLTRSFPTCWPLARAAADDNNTLFITHRSLRGC